MRTINVERSSLILPSFAGIGTGVALRLIFAAWCVIKGIVRKLRCLLYPAMFKKILKMFLDEFVKFAPLLSEAQKKGY